MNISLGFSEITQPRTRRNTITRENLSIEYVIFSTTNTQVTPVDRRALRSILVTAGTVYKRRARATTMAARKSSSISLPAASAPSMM
jgi:hypothetical protein